MQDDNGNASIVQIPLSRGQVSIIDAADQDLANFKWHFCPGPNTGYAVRTVVDSGKRATRQIHCVILERMLGRPLIKGEMVDHVNRNGLDNRRQNLRLASQSQNVCNRTIRPDNKSGFKGVFWDNIAKKWRSVIYHKGRQINLGRFQDIHEAAKAYNEAAVIYHGEFALLNTIPVEDNV